MPYKDPEKNRERARRAYAADPSRAAARSKKWQEANPDKVPAKNRRHHLKHKFNMTLEQYDALLAQQGGTCAICLGRPGGKRLAIDHNHETDVIRGLLCANCNQGLGHFMDNPTFLNRAKQYLEFAYTPQTGLTVASEDDQRVGVKVALSAELFAAYAEKVVE